jgi:hypothetical protein
MKLFRKHKEPDQNATDEPGTSALSLKSLLRALRTTGFYAIKGMSEKEQRRVWDWSKEVIRKYRRTLERNPANIRPVEELPFPKEEIKLAIQLSLPFYEQKNIQSMVKKLKTSYKELGVFQSIEPEDKDKLSKMSGQQDKLSVEPYREGLEVLGKYMEMVITEKKSLIEEINDFSNRMENLR